MSSTMKPVLPPTGGQTTAPNASPPKPLPPQNLPHNVPTSYTQPISHVPQNLGMPHSTNLSANIMPNMAPQNQQPINQASPLSIQAQISSPNKNAGLPTSRPNMIPFHPNSSDEGTTLQPSQNAAQLMAVHREQQIGFNKPQSNGTAPAQPEVCNKSPAVPAPVEVRPESPQVTTQNHIPESAKQPVEAPPKPTTPQPAEKPSAPSPQLPQPNNTPPEKSPSPTPAPVVPLPAPEPPKEATPPTPAVVPPPAAEPPTTEATQPPQSPPTKQTPPPVTPKETPATPTKPTATPTKPPTTMKLATTSPRVAQRQAAKREAAKKESEGEGEVKVAKNKVVKAKGKIDDDEGKAKRQRIRTQPYQSPLPELALITKLSSTPIPKAIDEKLIVFYKNEFLAVRNAEGGFYVCQAVQNVYKSSPRIKIRWLSQDKNDKMYIPDFYDVTDFDCILTNINMERIEKGKYNLPKVEEERTENILKRAIAVENGDDAPSLTEEHPDGLDLSLFRDESQLKKKQRGAKRKASRSTSPPSKKKSPAKTPARKTPARQSTSSASSSSTVEKKKAVKSAAGRSERAKRRGEVSTSSSPISSTKSSPVVDHKKAKVLAKVAVKAAASGKSHKKKAIVAVKPTPPTKSTPMASTSRTKSTRSAGTVAAATPTTSKTRGKKTRK